MTTESLVPVLSGLLTLTIRKLLTLIAVSRKHPRRMAILVIDLLASWTIIGWFFALAWALLTWQESAAIEPAEKAKARASAA